MDRSWSVQRSRDYMRRYHQMMPLFIYSFIFPFWVWLDSSLTFSGCKAMWWQEAQLSQNSYLLHCHFAYITSAGSVPRTNSSSFDVVSTICHFCTATKCQEMCYLVVMIRNTSECVAQEKLLSYLASVHSYPYIKNSFTKISYSVKYPKLVNTSWRDSHLLCECPC